MLTAMIGFVTVAHLFVVDCRNQHLQTSLQPTTIDSMYGIVDAQWQAGDKYHA